MSNRTQHSVRQLLEDFGLDDVVGQDLTSLVYSRGLLYKELPMSGCEGRIVFDQRGRGTIWVCSTTHSNRGSVSR